jgi:hypothetical protein
LRLPVSLVRDLKIRLVKDRERTGDRMLGMNHYITAALQSAPLDNPAAAAVLGAEWQQAHAIGKTLSTGSGYNLHVNVTARLASLADRLQLLDNRVWAWQVAAQAITVLLADLNGTGKEEAGGRGGSDGTGTVDPGEIPESLGPGL